MIFVYIFVGLIALLLIISAMMPKSYSIEKTIVIDRPPVDVLDKISNLNYYNQWNPWAQMEPNANLVITGEPGKTGHRYAWEGKKIGVGRLTLNNADTKHVDFDLEFFKPWKSKAKDNWMFEPWGTGSQTKVTWQNSGALPWPMASLMGPMINKNLNHQFSKGIENLKKLAETSSS